MSEYYVVKKGDEHKGWMDGCIIWWRESGHGYTYDLNDAGVFTDEDKAANYPPTDGCQYIPKEIVDAHCKSFRLAWWSAPLSFGNIVEALKQAGRRERIEKRKSRGRAL